MYRSGGIDQEHARHLLIKAAVVVASAVVRHLAQKVVGKCSKRAVTGRGGVRSGRWNLEVRSGRPSTGEREGATQREPRQEFTSAPRLKFCLYTPPNFSSHNAPTALLRNTFLPRACVLSAPTVVAVTMADTMTLRKRPASPWGSGLPQSKKARQGQQNRRCALVAEDLTNKLQQILRRKNLTQPRAIRMPLPTSLRPSMMMLSPPTLRPLRRRPNPRRSHSDPTYIIAPSRVAEGLSIGHVASRSTSDRTTTNALSPVHWMGAPRLSFARRI